MRGKEFDSNWRRCFEWCSEHFNPKKLKKSSLVLDRSRRKSIWLWQWQLVKPCRLVSSMFPSGKLLIYRGRRRLEFAIASLLADG